MHTQSSLHWRPTWTPVTQRSRIIGIIRWNAAFLIITCQICRDSLLYCLTYLFPLSGKRRSENLRVWYSSLHSDMYGPPPWRPLVGCLVWAGNGWIGRTERLSKILCSSLCRFRSTCQHVASSDDVGAFLGIIFVYTLLWALWHLYKAMSPPRHSVVVVLKYVHSVVLEFSLPILCVSLSARSRCSERSRLRSRKILCAMGTLRFTLEATSTSLELCHEKDMFKYRYL